METLRSSDLAALLEFAAEIAKPTSVAEFPRLIVEALARLLPLDSIGYQDYHGTEIIWSALPEDLFVLGDEQYLLQAAEEHPLIRYHSAPSDGRAAKISDFISQRQLHDLGVYSNLYRRTGVEYQIAFCIPRPRDLLAISLHRTSIDFDERERLMLDSVRLHITQAHANAESLSAMHNALESSGLGVISVDSSGSTIFASDGAIAKLHAYFDDRVDPTTMLPRAVGHWLRHELVRTTSTDDLPSPTRLVRHRRGSSLVCDLVLVDGGRGGGRILVREHRTSPGDSALQNLGLSRREAQVLDLAAQGHSDADIAALLVLSRRTVEKHLENVRSKLGVESTLAAVAIANTQPR